MNFLVTQNNCMCVRMYVCTLCVCMYVCVRCVCVLMCVCTCVCICMCVCCVCTCVRVCAYVCVCVCVWSEVIYLLVTHNLLYNRGESVTVQAGEVTASAWMDRKTVMVMSTNNHPSACGIVSRKQRDGSSLEVPCPASIISYNKFMGGVDRGDQLRGYYRCRSKSRKVYKYIFFFLFDVVITKTTPNENVVSRLPPAPP